MDQITLRQLTMSLKDYNPTAYHLMASVSSSMGKVAMVFLLMLMGFEILNWHQQLKSNGGEMTMSLWIELVIKYTIAAFLVCYIDNILDVISWFLNGLIKVVAHNNIAPFSSKAPSYKGVNTMTKLVLKLTYDVVTFIGGISTKLLMLLRSYTLYLFKGLAKIMVACYMLESLRPICFGFIKQYIAAALQGLIIVLILMLYPAIVTDDLLAASDKLSITPSLIAIAKGIIYIVLLFGSQRLAKSLMQVH